MATTTNLHLPDTQNLALPVNPHTWTDAAATTPGEPLRSRYLEQDAGGTAAWIRQRPTFIGFASLALSIPASTWTAVTGLTELIDNCPGHSDTVNTGRYFAPATNSDNGSGAGDWYLVIGNVPMNGNSTTNAHIAGIRVNGSASAIYEGAKLPGNAGHGVTPAIVDLIQLSGFAGDYIELAGWTDEASVSTVVSSKAPNLQIRWACMSNNGFITAFTPSLPATPHTWTATDIFTGSATGGAKVPLNTELRDTARFLNNPPCFRVHCSGTAQTMPGAGVWTAFTFQGESLDPYGMWSSGASVTCQRAGVYYIAGLAAVTETATKAGYRAVRIHHNIAAGGTADYLGSTIQAGTGTNTTGTTMLAAVHVRLAVGDTLQLQFAHTNATALPALGTSVRSCARMIGVWERL